ncbi:DUF4192 domain-containing protein [Arthrobacter sp. MSA 4-2]|uniref:DUF4192 domain-containing protein n=1 Tax=Arthrobacter sp. MSA 4-2 TaxID=2794349 RepID=UPI0018E7B410|nr:DUF4192 domain-containing protein [Arthrobacter sp. MSA 4-2]MBJ2122179.1 DUF4192 domain-containing protein [Arthrobacter sp. MSA 4-2]
MTSDPERLHLGTAADLLSYIPHAIGFVPVESLVVLTLSGGRVGATLRVDLPGPDAEAGSYAEGVAAILASDTAADGAVMILYTDARWSEPGRPPYGRVVRELERTLRAAGTPLRDGWVVSGTAWREYFCVDTRCCPWPGRPLAEISDSAASAELVLRGSSFSPSVETAAALPPGSAVEGKPSVEALAASYRRRCERTWTTASQFRATLLVWDHLLSGRRPPLGRQEHETAAFLLAGLSCKAVRDSVLVLAGCGLEAAEQGARACGAVGDPGLPGMMPVVPRSAAGQTLALEAPRGGEPGGSAGGGQPARRGGGQPAAPNRESIGFIGGGPLPAGDRAGACRRYSDFLVGRSFEAPRWDTLDAAHDLLLRLSAVSADESQAAVHSMLGWIEFARGRGSLACVYFERAERACPGYRLAGLLKELLLRGGLPEWACSPDTAWSARRGRLG